MTRLTFFFMLLFCVSTVNAAEPSSFWDFHGVFLGSNEKTILEKYPSFECKAGGSIRRCSTYFKFSEHPGFLSDNGATNVSLVFVDDKLVNIDIMWFPTAFEESYQKLKNAYGAPLNEKKEEIATADGRVLENKIVIWHNGVSTVRYDKYWGNAGVSRILYMLK